MVRFLYRWLPIFCGCHCREDRSFHWKGKKFPVCARCTGECAGILLGVIVFFFYRTPMKYCLLLLLPMIIDGTVQLKTSYESTNLRRCVTGFLFGYGITMLLLQFLVMLFFWGYRQGKSMRA